MLLSLTLNGINLFLTFYLSFLFLWWWIKFHKATAVYKAHCILMVGLFLQYYHLTRAMFLKVVHDEDLDVVISGCFTAPSKILITLCLIWYAVYFTKRAYQNKIGKRIDDA